MSQHHFDAKGYRVTTGWDRPLQHFFLTIERPTRATPVYCNLYDPDLPTGGMTLAQVFDTLRRHGITPPGRLERELAADQLADVGNRVVSYAAVEENR